jgi:hypothetical protein
MANLVATGQINLSDFIAIDYEGDHPTGHFVFTKEQENVLIPNAIDRVGAMGTAASPGARITPIPTKKQFP